ncbi:hypothetical protein DP57_6099 [Burkholderia pseudomallei]|uniref:zinc-ribbon domain-containing protein n=1 Tax=Burkholderia pseudomallei TaxID=28450 RepID=UPI00050EF255|nr:zinc-ribbon domain-containing protein [Burkholderia pseudomallei]KGC70174.1 hypothetical protein DP57_6099 [Burkholderia pseudomallei]
MTKTLRELLVELEQLDREIERIGPKTTASREQADARGEGTSCRAPIARPPQVRARIRKGVQFALEALPDAGARGASDYRYRLFHGIRKVATAWGGVCLSDTYEGHKVPLEFVCAAGHRFSMHIHGLRIGNWCQACSYSRATVYSMEVARAAAAKHEGWCLSREYRNSREKMRWRCKNGHTWSANLAQVLHGDWCQKCHFDRIKPRQEDIERAAIERGGRCLSAYVDKETPLQWQCAEGHTWLAPWFRVSKGQWCHLCAVKARTRTIEQMQQLAQSRDGRCLSTVYPGAHGKIEWQCAKGHAWRATVNSVCRGSWCPECAWESRRMARRKKKSKNYVPIMV